MNPNVWNIKEILSIPSVSSRNVATSGYSSLSDSQFVFGSQFWPENSQCMSQEMSFSSRTSQQSSQEGSEPKFMSNYHTKPFLFGEGKDKTSAQKAVGMLDKFEEDRKKAKEKSESDILAKEVLHFRETLKNIQQGIIGTEENTAVCKTILQGFNSFETVLQKNLASLQSGISEQFETMLNKVSSQKEMLTGMEEKVHKTGVITTELGSHVHSIKNNLEALRKEQGREQNVLDEALNLLNTLVSKYSAKSNPVKAIDRAIQTSPGLVKQFSNIQPNIELRGKQLTPRKLECSQAEVPSQGLYNRCLTGKRRSTPMGHRRRRKRPLLLSQRSKDTVWDENSQPLKQEITSTPLKQLHDLNRVTSRKPDCLTDLNRETRVSKAVGGFLSPLSCWSQDSDSPVCTTAVEPKMEIPGKTKGLWQLFEINGDSDS